MHRLYFNTADIVTPAFVYDEGYILDSLTQLTQIRETCGCKILFALKAFAFADALRLMVPMVDGFAASSLFECKLAREIIGDQGAIHMTSPGIHFQEIALLADICDYMSFNSVGQWLRFNQCISGKVQCGLRINPKLSFVSDERYNPCRKYSKLGVPLNKLSEMSNNGSKPIKDIKGLHFHTNCESTNFDHLLRTVQHTDAYLAKLLGQVDWVNLGGGYLFDNAQNSEKLIEAVALLRDKYDVEVFFEPGRAIVGSAGYIISTVIDIFGNDGRTIAVLDTSVNHMPEVFEYQYKPDIMQESTNGKYRYTLAGATCLAGDLFGEYRFHDPLEIGSRIVFEDMGAYTLVKAHMFNGVNLPTIYAYTRDGKLELKKRFDYEDFKSKWR